MPADLEAQLRASMPGRETAVQDFSALEVAREQVRLAIDLLTRARGTVAVVLGRDRPAAEHLDAADLSARKAGSDLEIAARRHPAGRVQR